MPVTCRDVITRALTKARIYAAGETPSAEDMDDGLDELLNLYEQWGSNGMFGRLTDVMTADDYEASPNERITATDSAVITIPTSFESDGEDFPPYDTAFVEVVDTVAQTVMRYIYEGGEWVEVSGLGLDDAAPLSGRGRGGLSACLALALAEEFGGEIGPGVQRQAASFKTGLALKYGSDAQRTAPEYY